MTARVPYAVVAVLAVGWVCGFVVSLGGLPTDPPPDLGYAANVAVAWALVAVSWMVAVRLLRSRLRTGAPAGAPASDPPARLLDVAVATLPDDRRDWAAAMSAELAHVSGRRSRWLFAAGCARAALFPPRPSRVPVLVAGVLAAASVALAAAAVGGVLPAMGVFAVAFAGLGGGIAVLAVARSRRLRPPAAGPAVIIAGVVGVAACIVVTGNFLVRYPVAAAHLPPPAAVFLAAVLIGFLCLMLAPPHGLRADRLARRVAVVAAVVLGAGLVLASDLGLRGVTGLEDIGMAGYLYLVPVAVIFAGSALAAAAGGSFRAGVQAATWTALLASLAIFAAALPEAVRWYEADASLILAGDGVPVDAVGENIRNFLWGLVLLPLWWLPFGVFGAAAGLAMRPTRRRGAADTGD